MRSNLEDNNAFGLQLKSGMLGSVAKTLTGDITLPVKGPLLHFFNGGLSNRTITLPAVDEGQFLTIFNTGTTNTLIVQNNSAVTIATVYPLHSVQFYSSETEWVSFGHIYGVAGTGHKPGIVPDPGLTQHADSVKLYLREDGWAEVSEISGDDFIKYITDGTTTTVPVGADTVRVRSSDGSISVTVQNNDATYGDNINLAVIEAQVDHNLLGNYVGNQHIDHTTVSVLTAANSGLAGGGTIAASRSLVIDVSNLAVIAPVLADSVPFYNLSGLVTGRATFTVINGILDHNALLNYSADQHIAHSGVSISAGTGLTGGGTIAASRTISLDINGLAADTLAGGDFFAFYDISGLDHNKITFANLNTSLDHNVLTNYVAAQHKTHPTSTDLAIAKYTGTGGDLANSAVLIDASNNVTGIAALSATTIELGAVSDTTISRTGAGAIAVEGVGVALNAITLTHTALQLELGHATDTTISRLSAGIIAVEGLALYSNIPQNSQSAAYTLVLADAQRHLLHPSADTTARIWTIPANASVAFPIGSAVTFINQNAAGVITISITTDTLRLAGPGTTGSRTLAANGAATAVKVTATEWIISGTGLT